MSKTRRATAFVGRRGAVLHSISAIDMALWDIRGRAEGVPVAELLGGARRERLRAYATIWPTGDTPDELCRNADRDLGVTLNRETVERYRVAG